MGTMVKRIEPEMRTTRARPERGLKNEDMTGNKEDRDQAECVVMKGVSERRGRRNSRIRGAVAKGERRNGINDPR